MGYLDNKGLEKYTWNVRNRVAKNDQLTKTEQIVSFCPAPETKLDPIVNFMFKETLPAEGEKGPENPSTIAGVSEIKLSRCGKNLFPLSKAPKYNDSQTINGVTFTMNEDGWITCNGTASARTSYFFIPSGLRVKVPAGTYTISGMPDASYGVNAGLNICTYSSLEPLVLIDNSTDTGNGKIFTLNEAGYIVVGIAISSGVKLENYIIKPQLEVGSKATLFEPYKGNDFSFPLNEIYYGGSVNLATGEMTVTYKGIVFDGTEDWSGPDDHGGGCYSFGLSINSHGTSFPYSSPNAHLLSSHFDYIANTSLQSNHFYVPGQGGFLAVYTMFCTTLQDWKDWLASQSQNGTPLVVAYRLETPQTVQLDPIQVKSLASSDKYNHPVNYVYSNQESVQIGWTREDVVHKSDEETIDGLKTFSGTIRPEQHVVGTIIRNNDFTRGTNPPHDVYWSIPLCDVSSPEWDADQSKNHGRAGLLECRAASNGNITTSIRAYKNDLDSANNSIVAASYDSVNDIPYATAPSTSSERANDTDIVTRDWLPKDTRIPQKSDLWNWQKTEKAGAVAFKPVPGSDLEPVVDFMFTEILPASGNKGPENPSTLTGVSSIKMSCAGKNCADIRLAVYPDSGLQFTKNSDGTFRVYGNIPTNSEHPYINIYHNTIGDVIDRIKPGVTYTASFNCTNSNAVLQLLSHNNNYTTLFEIRDGDHSTFTMPDDSDDACWLRLAFPKGEVDCLCSIQIEVGKLATDFELPAVRNTYTIQLGDTYYGGSLDVATGVMTVTHWADTITSAYGLNRENTNTVGVSAYLSKIGELGTNNLICDALPFVANQNDSEHIRFLTGGNAVVIYISKSRLEYVNNWVDPATAWLTQNPITVVYKLATPFTVQLTSTQIKSLLALDKYDPRINTIYTDQKVVQVGYQRYANYVNLTTDQTIDGQKTFNSSPVVPIPSLGDYSNLVATTKWVKDLAMTAVYVSPNGSDSNSGMTAAESVKSINRGIEIIKSIPQSSSAVPNLYIAEGTYTENVNFITCRVNVILGGNVTIVGKIWIYRSSSVQIDDTEYTLSISASTSGTNLLTIQNSSYLACLCKINFTLNNDTAIYVLVKSNVVFDKSINISGSSTASTIYATDLSHLQFSNTVTSTSSCNAFAHANLLSTIKFYHPISCSGSATNSLRATVKSYLAIISDCTFSNLVGRCLFADSGGFLALGNGTHTFTRADSNTNDFCYCNGGTMYFSSTKLTFNLGTSGSAGCLRAISNAFILFNPKTLETSGSCGSFALADYNSFINVASNITKTGSLTSARYYVRCFSYITVHGAGANYLPGNSAGTIGTNDYSYYS